MNWNSCCGRERNEKSTGGVADHSGCNADPPGIMRQVSAVPGFSENEADSEDPSTGESEIRIASDGKRPSADHAPSSAETNASAESATGSSGAPDIRSGIRLIWAIGALSFLIIIILNNLLFALSCRKNARYLGRDRETGMRICLLPGIRSPFLFGTRVYLPPDIIKNHAMNTAIFDRGIPSGRQFAMQSLH